LDCKRRNQSGLRGLQPLCDVRHQERGWQSGPSPLARWASGYARGTDWKPSSLLLLLNYCCLWLGIPLSFVADVEGNYMLWYSLCVVFEGFSGNGAPTVWPSNAAQPLQPRSQASDGGARATPRVNKRARFGPIAAAPVRIPILQFPLYHQELEPSLISIQLQK
jgi:hypothetical protein